MTMTEQQYLLAQERKTRKALHLLKHAHQLGVPQGSPLMRRYYRLCEGSLRLRRAYTRHVQQQLQLTI